MARPPEERRPELLLGTRFVIADLSGQSPRFLSQRSWSAPVAVTLDPDYALQFRTNAAADLALEAWRSQAGGPPDAGEWRIWRVTLHMRFSVG